MRNQIEEAFYNNYLEFFNLAERKRRWNVEDDIPWDKCNANASKDMTEIVETFAGVELFLPDYTSKILHLVRKSRGRAWFQANWGYEESKHSLALFKWLETSGRRTKSQLDAFEGDLLGEEWDLPFDSPRQMIIYTMIQELATFISYRGLQTMAVKENDQALAQALNLIAIDEKTHYNFFRQGVKLYFEQEPDDTLKDFVYVLRNFKMPAQSQIRDYPERSRTIANNGVFGSRDFILKVKEPIMKDLNLSQDLLMALKTA
jgi:acyl-[acyl-carrier-protein] desaturase